MKTWTNPEVEELDIELTAYYKITKEVEWFNGKLDGSLIIGGNTGNTGETPGDGTGEGTGSEGSEGSEGTEGDEDGFGTES